MRTVIASPAGMLVTSTSRTSPISTSPAGAPAAMLHGSMISSRSALTSPVDQAAKTYRAAPQTHYDRQAIDER
jgi:hypothetical protein